MGVSNSIELPMRVGNAVAARGITTSPTTAEDIVNILTPSSVSLIVTGSHGGITNANRRAVPTCRDPIIPSFVALNSEAINEAELRRIIKIEVAAAVYSIQGTKELECFISRIASTGANTPAGLVNEINRAVDRHVTSLTIANAVNASFSIDDVLIVRAEGNLPPSYMRYAMQSVQGLISALYTSAIMDAISHDAHTKLLVDQMRFTASRIEKIDLGVFIFIGMLLIAAFIISGILLSHLHASHVLMHKSHLGGVGLHHIKR